MTLRKSSEHLRESSETPRNIFGKPSEIFGKWSGAHRKSSGILRKVIEIPSGSRRKSAKKNCVNKGSERHLSCYYTLARTELILVNESPVSSLWDRICVPSLRMHTDTTHAQEQNESFLERQECESILFRARSMILEEFKALDVFF